LELEYLKKDEVRKIELDEMKLEMFGGSLIFNNLKNMIKI
jgi:hypothetical protein